MRRFVFALCLTALVVVLTPVLAVAAARVEVELTDAGCPKRIEARSGRTTFDVTNVDASAVSEFEVLQGHRVLGERENLAPGLSASFTVDLEPGTYVTYCPGGDRERGKLVVTGTGSAASNAPTRSVDVRVREFTVRPEPTAVKAGSVRFAVRNTGTVVHEFVVVRTDGTPLPLSPDGSVDEAALPDGAFVGELEDLAPKTRTTLRDDLTSGTYVLFCNIVEDTDSGVVNHYELGMHTKFIVR